MDGHCNSASQTLARPTARRPMGMMQLGAGERGIGPQLVVQWCSASGLASLRITARLCTYCAGQCSPNPTPSRFLNAAHGAGRSLPAAGNCSLHCTVAGSVAESDFADAPMLTGKSSRLSKRLRRSQNDLLPATPIATLRRVPPASAFELAFLGAKALRNACAHHSMPIHRN